MNPRFQIIGSSNEVEVTSGSISHAVGRKRYELTNHLGNVLTVISDRRIAADNVGYEVSPTGTYSPAPGSLGLYHAFISGTTTYVQTTGTDGIIDYFTAEIISSSEYSAFGVQLQDWGYQSEDYRYAFNGKELDKPGMGGGQSTYDYGFRIYNPAIAKFLSVDPLTKEYPWYTPYQFAGNKPIWAIDLDGLEEFIKTTFFNSSGEVYKVEIQVIKATTDFGQVTGMQSNTQLVHQTYVIYDDAGNYDVYNAGVVEGVWSNAQGVGANDPNGNPVGGSTAFNQQENSLIWFNTATIDPAQGAGNAIGYPNSETGKLGYSFVPNGGATIVNSNYTANPDGIVQFNVPSANGAPNPNTNGAAPPGIHNTNPTPANRVSTDGVFGPSWRGAGKDYNGNSYLRQTNNPIAKMVGRILNHTPGQIFNVPSEANENNLGAPAPYNATYH